RWPQEGHRSALPARWACSSASARTSRNQCVRPTHKSQTGWTQSWQNYTRRTLTTAFKARKKSATCSASILPISRSRSVRHELAMATGGPPFRASGTMGVLKRVCEDEPQPMREANPQVPNWLDAIVAKLHAKNPDDRFQSAQEVGDLLGQHIAHLQEPQRAPRARDGHRRATVPRFRHDGRAQARLRGRAATNA